MLMMDNPDGTKPAIHLTTMKDFYQVRPRTNLFETKLKASFYYLGICDDDCVFVENDGTIYRYYLSKENIYKYDAGSPQRVVMELNRIVNAESLGAKDDYHTGVLYNFHVEWAEPNANTQGVCWFWKLLNPSRQRAGSHKHKTANRKSGLGSLLVRNC